MSRKVDSFRRLTAPLLLNTPALKTGRGLDTGGFLDWLRVDYKCSTECALVQDLGYRLHSQFRLCERVPTRRTYRKVLWL
jgi:hypothetical protein